MGIRETAVYIRREDQLMLNKFIGILILPFLLCFAVVAWVLAFPFAWLSYRLVDHNEYLSLLLKLPKSVLTHKYI
jgi:hypothetical protein